MQRGVYKTTNYMQRIVLCSLNKNSKHTILQEVMQNIPNWFKND